MPPPERVWTVVVAGGSGRRFGGVKQFEPIGPGPDAPRVVDVAVRTARAVSDGVVLVVPAEFAEREGGVPGGASRSESVRAGLAEVPDDATIVCVHDAARPFATEGLFTAVIDAVVAGADAAVPGVPVADTIKVVDGKAVDRAGAADIHADGTSVGSPPPVVTATPDRDTLVAVQTPQAFRAEALRSAHAAGGEGTDDASLVERDGGRVVVVPGDPDNVKITRPDDLARSRAVPDGWHRVPELRVGQGFDIHRFSDDPARPLVLGGCTFDGEPGLVGHSDADAVAHAVADALLGAAGLGDIGQHFPDTDPQWAGADSIGLLGAVATMVRADGWTIGNVDCSVICERPRIAPRREEMQSCLASAVGAPVTVSGRRAEGLGAIGRREGVACTAVAILHRNPTEEVSR